MSREVLGLAPDEPDLGLRSQDADSTSSPSDGAAPPSTDSTPAAHPASAHPASAHPASAHPASAHPASAHPASAHPASARRVALLVIAALALGAALGWATAGRVGSPDLPDAASPLDAAATIVDLTSTQVVGTEATAVLAVRVTNTGTVPLTVTGAAKGLAAGRVDGLSREAVPVEPGAAQDVDVRVGIACDSTARLALPPLTVRREDGTLRPLEIGGAAAALASICERAEPSGRLLFVTGVEQDDERLRITVNVPNGRTLRLIAISVGGTALTGRPLPVTLDTPDRVIWLDPPTACAAGWRSQGVPERFELTLQESVGDPTPIHLSRPGGLVLADWLLTSACGGGA